MNSTLKFLNFSPNSSKVNTPLAESTAIGSPLTKQIQGNPKRKSISPISNNSKQKTNLKIDPHVLTDAQSNGIVTRLVKYYDQSNEPERSRTVYSKFGDYPLVHLKKTELKRPISRSTAVRIAPPNRTIMNPNLRAAIMRSSSFQMNSGIPKIIPTKMRAKDDSHKIITNHEPITDPNYPVSSKSVLDALEKNCRKRINNEELTLDRSKKLCAPIISEIVDSPSPREFIPISSNQQTAKRNREELSPSKSSQPSFVADISSNQAKKVKIKNNALLSSLSSSHFELSPSISSTIQNNSRISSLLPSSPKIAPKSKEIIKEKESNNNHNDDKVVKLNVEELKPKEIQQQQPQKKLQLFNAKPDPNAAINKAKLKAYERNVSEEDEDEDEIKIRFVKPKEKVLENYDVINYVEKDKLDKMLRGLSQGIKSPVKEFAEGNKGKDTVDSQIKAVTSEAQVIASISFTTSTTSSTISPISTPSISSAVISINPSVVSNTLTSDKNKKENEIPTSSISISSGIETSTSSISTISLPKPTMNFQFGTVSSTTTQSDVPKSIISSAATSAMIIPSKPISPLAVFSTPKIDQTPAPSDPTKSLISFTPVKATENVTTAQKTLGISTAVTTSTSLSMFGSGGFKFGESTTTISKEENKPSAGGFSFGSNNTASDKVEPKKISTSGFSFGSNNNTAQGPTVLTNTPSFSFGSGNIPKLPTSSPLLTGNASLSFQNPVTTASNTPNMFSFGANSTPSNLQSPQTTASSTFGSNIGIVSPMSNNPPSFVKPETTVASGVGFSFGSSNNKPANSAFSFSGSPQMPSPAATTTSNFSFGSQSPATTQSAGMFSASATTAAPNFPFGSGTTNITTGNSPSGFTGFGSTAPQKTESSGLFAFGQKPQTAPVTTTNSGFSFGSPLSQNSSSALSAQPSISSAFSFGQSTAPTNNENKTTGIFSRLGEKQPEIKPFSFGGNNTNNNLQQNSSTLAFGSGNSIMATATSAPTIFGSNQSNTTSVFGQSATLGNNTGNLFSPSNNNNNQATSSPFGSNASQPQSGNNLFSFGTSPNSNNNSGNNNNNTNSQPSAGIFGFSSSNNTNNNNNNNNNANTNAVSPTSSNSIFGSSNNNSGQNVSASFTFNTATGNVTNSQQQSPFGQNSAPPPYQFGTSNTGNNASASFTFSGSSVPSSAPTPQSNAQPFNFGQSNNAPVPGNFNFQGQTTAVPQPSPAGLFNIGTGGNQQQRRPTRVATRRYK